MVDSHVHTNVSHDGISAYKDYIYEARCKGVDRIIFTEHLDFYKGVNSKLETLNLNYYRDEYLTNIEPDQLTTGFGIEVGLRPECGKEITIAISSQPFDFVIGSSHITKSKDISKDSSFFESITPKEAIITYYNEVLENIDKYYEYFDVYGHLDYPIRYIPKNYSPVEVSKLNFKDYEDKIVDVLASLIKHDKGIELNTSAFKHNIEVVKQILKHYKELCGKIITIGSDAHRVDDLGYKFREAEELLLNYGFSEYAYYKLNERTKKREPIFCKTLQRQKVS